MQIGSRLSDGGGVCVRCAAVSSIIRRKVLLARDVNLIARTNEDYVPAGVQGGKRSGGPAAGVTKLPVVPRSRGRFNIDSENIRNLSAHRSRQGDKNIEYSLEQIDANTQCGSALNGKEVGPATMRLDFRVVGASGPKMSGMATTCCSRFTPSAGRVTRVCAAVADWPTTSGSHVPNADNRPIGRPVSVHDASRLLDAPRRHPGVLLGADHVSSRASPVIRKHLAAHQHEANRPRQ
ncbi:hypothetical protein KM043_017427 [Ampulex compressa]|nr:hypothetical protein KM043_017427 [Ampulex compressa]